METNYVIKLAWDPCRSWRCSHIRLYSH